MLKKLFVLTAGFLMAGAFSLVSAADMAYDEKADADAQVAQAFDKARATKKNVLLVFGANWCPDCRELDKTMKGKSAAMINEKFEVVKVDIGRFDKNMHIPQAYGNPTKKGIPAAVMITPDKRVIYATRGGELADARNMSDTGVYDFFVKVLAENK